MSLLLENSLPWSSHMDYNPPYLRKGLNVAVCTWEIWSLHNLEMQLQHELISRANPSVMAQTQMEWLRSAEQGVFIIRQCQGCPRHRAAAGAAPGWGCGCWPGTAGASAETKCSLWFLLPSCTALAAAAGKSELTERISPTLFYINARFSPSSPQLPCWFLWTLHSNFGHTAWYILWSEKTKEIMQKQARSQFLLCEPIDCFPLFFRISLK